MGLLPYRLLLTAITAIMWASPTPTKDSDSVLWEVPVTIATKTHPQAVQLVMSERCAVVTVKGVEDGDWVLVNPSRVGYYRVSYTSDMLSNLRQALQDNSLSAMDRMGLQNDAFALSTVGEGSIVEFLNLLPFYCSETNYDVWESVCTNLSSLSRLLAYTPLHHSFRAFAEKLFSQPMARLGWQAKNTDTPSDALLRSLIIACYSKYGNQETIREAQSRFQRHVEGTELLNSDLKSAVYGIVMSNGDTSTFEQLLKLHDATDSSEERSRIYFSLGYGSTDELTTKCLQYSLSDNVRANDSWTLLSSAAHCSPRARELVWQFVKENWSFLQDKFQASFLLGKIVDVSTFGFASEEKAVEIEQFFQQHPCPLVERTVQQNCEAIRLHAHWLHRETAVIEQWLVDQ